jgi:hypothetical protein
MPSRPRRLRTLACLPLAIALALAATATAPAAPRQTASVTFTSKKPGSLTGVDWAIDYRNPDDPAAKPYAVAQNSVVFPAGSTIDTAAPVQCRASDSELTLEGPGACPRASRVATGTLDVDTGSLSDALFPRVIHNDVTNLNNEGESIIYTESTNMPSAQTRTVTRAKVTRSTITTDVPPLPGTPPPDPYTALKRFRLLVPAYARAGRRYVTTPRSCPSSRHWVFKLTFVYRDGAREVVRSRTPCVRKRGRR